MKINNLLAGHHQVGIEGVHEVDLDEVLDQKNPCLEKIRPSPKISAK